MNDVVSGTAVCVAAYLVGSLPFGYWTAWIVAGRDIRTMGSGNIGATNVARSLGGRWGALVLLFDALKGYLPTYFLAPLAIDAASPNFLHVRVACGMATIAGHMFPCWLLFRGGKGVATALGVVAVLAPWGTLAAVLTFAVSVAVWRIVSLSSMLAALIFAGFQWMMHWPEFQEPRGWSLAAFSTVVPLLILFRHRSNISRLLRGDEPKFQSSRRGEPSPEPGAGDRPPETTTG